MAVLTVLANKTSKTRGKITGFMGNTHRKQGGNDPFGVHCPTKTAPLECDIRRGRSLDVPAIDMATRPNQKPGKPSDFAAE